VPLPDWRLVAAGPQPLESELPDRRQHAEALRTRARCRLAHEAPADQGVHNLEPLISVRRVGQADCFESLERATADEDRQAPKEPLPAFSEQVVAPGDCVPQSALPKWHISPAGREKRQTAVQARTKQPGDLRRGIEDMFEVVQDQQHFTVLQVIDQALIHGLLCDIAQLELFGDRGQNTRRVSEWRELKATNAVFKGSLVLEGYFESQARLAHAGWTGEGQHSHVWAT
jgi:hypothetical protein